MGVILTEDCVVREDGTYLCYDRQSRKYFVLSKKELALEDISKAEFAELVAKIGKPRCTLNIIAPV